jgi:hypothetical protein
VAAQDERFALRSKIIVSALCSATRVMSARIRAQLRTCVTSLIWSHTGPSMRAVPVGKVPMGTVARDYGAFGTAYVAETK